MNKKETTALNPDVVLARKQERVYNLTIELKEAKAAKKAAMGGHTDEIKRIEAEIKEVLTEENPPPVADSKTL